MTKVVIKKGYLLQIPTHFSLYMNYYNYIDKYYTLTSRASSSTKATYFEKNWTQSNQI